MITQTATPMTDGVLVSLSPLCQSDGPTVILDPRRGRLCTHEMKEIQEASAGGVPISSSPMIKLEKQGDYKK